MSRRSVVLSSLLFGIAWACAPMVEGAQVEPGGAEAVVVAPSAAPVEAPGAAPAREPILRSGDTLALVGGALAESMQHVGAFETTLHFDAPQLGLSVRNLGFSADELTVQQRTAGFGTADEHLARVGADVVLGFWGFNESFAGEAGLTDFEDDLREWIQHTRSQIYGESGPARVVLITPFPYEDTGDPLLPEAAPANARLADYADAMVRVASSEGVECVDLFEALSRAAEDVLVDQRFTRDGVHPNEFGAMMLGRALSNALLRDQPVQTQRSAEEIDAGIDQVLRIRELVLEKNRLWFNRYRATDGYNVYGGRSGLTYDGVTNYEVLQHELVVLDAMCANLDREIHAAARGEPAPDPLPVPALKTVETNRPGPNPDGSYVFRSGEEALAEMSAAPGMQVELFADEAMFPLLRNPVQMSWDTRGRLWVATWPTYPHWTPGEPMDDALLVLEDTDGDGRADTCTPFADDLHNPTGFEFWNGGVFVANPPDILFLKDTDGDGRADLRERVLGGLSSGDTHHSANSFVLGPGGALYFQEGIFHQSQVETVYGPVRNRDGCVWRYEPRTQRVTRHIPYGFLNPHGHVFDRWGQEFVTDGTGNVNYYALPFSGHVEQGRKHGGYFSFFDQRSRPAAATEILSSAHFPAENQGNYLIANVIGFQGIFQYALSDAGSGFSATEVEPLMQSRDPNFRPVDIEMGPDGAVYFLDWQNPLIGHMQHHLRDPNRDQGHGRIYRVRMADRPLLRPEPVAGVPMPELFGLLHSPDDRVRYRARIELSGRERDAVVEGAQRFVEELAMQDIDPAHALLEALWVQQAQGVLDEPLLDRVLGSPDARARAAGVRVLRWMRRALQGGSNAALDMLAKAVEDDDPRVRLEAVVALSDLGSEAVAEGTAADGARATELALKILARPSDRFLDYALEETLKTLEPSWKAALQGQVAFASGDEQGLERLLSRMELSELLGVQPRAAGGLPLREALRRHEIQAVTAFSFAAMWGAETGRGQAGELLEAIHDADARADGHADHLLATLFRALAEVAPDEAAGVAQQLTELRRDGRRASTRRLATAASMRATRSSEPAWSEAARSSATLADLVEAVPLVGDEGVARELFPKVAGVLATPTAELSEGANVQAGVMGVRVRVELPGEARTLTLAEVEVFSGEENVAPRGVTTQSSTNWGGEPSRGIDGITSGAYADGGQTHTMEDRVDPWWELELPAPEAIDRIVVWNRTESEGRWVSRLDGFVVRVLDAEGRTVWESAAQPGPAVRASLELTPPALRARRAAAHSLAELGVEPVLAVDALLAQLEDLDVHDAVIGALGTIDPASWLPAQLTFAANELLNEFASRPAADFLGASGRRALHLADRLSTTLVSSEDGAARELGAELLLRRRELGPQVIVLRPVRDSLTYDLSAFTVQAGRPVELLFENTDIMPHNVLLAARGALATVGEAGEAMAALPDAWERAFVPELPEVLIASGLLLPGESETLRFDAPSERGDYPYLCTFPGHWIRMNGVMHVVDELPAGTLVERRVSEGDVTGHEDARYGMRGPPPSGALWDDVPRARQFVRQWTAADFADATPADSRQPRRQQTFGAFTLEAASCLRCHRAQPGSDGGDTGPVLSEVVASLDTAQIFEALLDPSATIREGYESETLFLHSGEVVSGRILEETPTELALLDDPYSAEPRRIALEAIETRRRSSVSVMPEGLLSTFSEQEILALVAYLESLPTTAAER